MTALAALLVALLPALSGWADPSRGGPQTVRVLGPDGKPVAAAKVQLQVGLAHFALTEDFDRWSGVQRAEAETDAQGVARFEGLPAAGRVTAFARTSAGAGLAEGELGPELALALQATGGLTGKLASKHSTRGYSVVAVAARGFEHPKAELDDDSWSFTDLPLGEVTLEVRESNWLALRRTAEVKPGKPAKVPVLKLGEDFLTGGDPLVDVTKVRLIGADGKPLSGTKIAWSAPQMDGWSPADEDGEILMVGGGVMIGPPPFVLRLASVGIDSEQRWLGEFDGIQRGAAVVRAVSPLEPLSVRVTRGGVAVPLFQLYAVSGVEKPRAWTAKLENGVARVNVPAGKLRLFVGTPDGRIHEHALEKPAGAFEHELLLTDD